MSREEFYALTFRQWDALRRRLEESKHRTDEMTEIMGAQIVAMVRRCGFIRFKEPMEAKDFRPSEWRKRSEKPVRERRRSRQAIAGEYRNMMATVAKRAEL